MAAIPNYSPLPANPVSTDTTSNSVTLRTTATPSRNGDYRPVEAASLERSSPPPPTSGKRATGIQTSVLRPSPASSNAGRLPIGQPSTSHGPVQQLSISQVLFVEKVLAQWKEQLQSPQTAATATLTAIKKAANPPEPHLELPATAGTIHATGPDGLTSMQSTVDTDVPPQITSPTQQLIHTHLFNSMVRHLEENAGTLDRGAISYAVGALINQSVVLSTHQGCRTRLLTTLFQVASRLDIVEKIVGTPPTKGHFGEWHQGRGVARLLEMVRKTGRPKLLERFFDTYDELSKQLDERKCSEIRQVLRPYREDVASTKKGTKLAGLTQQWNNNLHKAIEQYQRQQGLGPSSESITEVVRQCLKGGQDSSKSLARQHRAQRGIPYTLIKDQVIRVFHQAQTGHLKGIEARNIIVSMLSAFNEYGLFPRRRDQPRANQQEMVSVIGFLHQLGVLIGAPSLPPSEKDAHTHDQALRRNVLEAVRPTCRAWLVQIMKWHHNELEQSSQFTTSNAPSFGLDEDQLREIEAIQKIFPHTAA